MPRRAEVEFFGEPAGVLEEFSKEKEYVFTYHHGYAGPPVSLALPVRSEPYRFSSFPPFLDGLLPEGVMLDALLRRKKIDKNDLFSQIVTVGNDLVGALTVREII